MKFIERLEGTSLENDNRAKMICALLDWFEKKNIAPPTEREWCELLWFFPKGKARHGKEKKDFYPQNQLHALLKKLDKEGVVAITWGRGKDRNSYKTPEEVNPVADKKADFERRKAELKNNVIEDLKDDVKNNKADWDGVRNFFEFWSEPDADYNMRCENIVKGTKNQYFSIRGRWINWKGKFGEKKTVEQKTIEAPEQNKEEKYRHMTMEEQNKLFDEWLKMKGIRASEFNPDTMFHELLQYIKEHL